MNLAFGELLRYTNDERDRWRRWFAAHPEALDAAFQPAGRLSTVGKLIDHIFLAEQRNLHRLMERPLADATGLTANNAAPLFDYGASVRRELEQFASDLADDEADEVRPITIRDEPHPMSARKLLFNILIHEMRHWAQIAFAVRLAGFEPPGDHDFLFSRALR